MATSFSNILHQMLKISVQKGCPITLLLDLCIRIASLTLAPGSPGSSERLADPL